MAISTTADAVYGQGGSFTSDTVNLGGRSASSLNRPYGVAHSPSGLYVTDSENFRVLFYPTGQTTATRVYGQLGSFVTGTANQGGVSADSLGKSFGIHYSSASDELFIVDSTNNRVLVYKGSNTTAQRVYGQRGSFSTNAANIGGRDANSLNNPVAVTTGHGGVYISDGNNRRVLFYSGESTTATRVYGQGGSFTTGDSNKGGISADSLFAPFGLAVTASGALVVVDAGNNRVLQYEGNSTTATTVYGQGGSFSSGTVNQGGRASGFSTPIGVLSTSAGLYVSELTNSRVLFFPGNATTPTAVWGQGGAFDTGDSNKGGISADSLDQPVGIATDGTNLFIADALNNRVLRFGPATTTSTTSTTTSTTTGTTGGSTTSTTTTTPAAAALLRTSVLSAVMFVAFSLAML